VNICGLDEAGRGPLAGPLVAAAVVLPPSLKATEGLRLKDSKKLSKRQREKLYKAIVESGSLVKTEIITARQINNKGIGWANVEIFRKLVKALDADKYIVDGNLKIKVKNKNVKSVVKADAKIKCVMAASIIAKVTRDRIMEDLHGGYPQYNWKENMGYGTRDHISAIREFGTVKYHRDVYVTTVLKS
jgi:ribonuclease HII